MFQPRPYVAEIHIGGLNLHPTHLLSAAGKQAQRGGSWGGGAHRPKPGRTGQLHPAAGTRAADLTRVTCNQQVSATPAHPLGAGMHGGGLQRAGGAELHLKCRPRAGAGFAFLRGLQILLATVPFGEQGCVGKSSLSPIQRTHEVRNENKLTKQI